MSKLNKLVTNYPVQLTNEEVENLSLTLSAVRTAGGGGGEGKTYHGEGFVSVNNTNNSISLTTEANEKLNQPIPTKVSDLTDSANYQTVADAASTYQTKDAMSAYATTAYVNGVTGSILYKDIQGLVDALNAKQDKLTFGYDENDAISSINSHKLAGAGGVTGDYYSASNPSGFINSTQAETQILAKNYITSGVSQLDNFYSKTDTSSKTELQTKFDSLLNYNVTAAAGIQVTTATDAGIKTFGISMTAEPVVTDTRLSGYNGVAAALDTNVSGLWNVGLTHDMLNTINGKLDTTDFNTYTATTAPSIYQEKGNYLSSNALEGYATTALLDTISGKIESDIPTTVAQLTDSGNYYQKTDTSSKNELSTEFANYQPKGNYLVADDITGKLDKSIYSNASGNWENTYNTVRQYSAAGTWLTAHQSLTNYYTKSQTSGATEIANALNTKVDKPIQQTGKLVYDGDTSSWVTLPAGTTTIVQGQDSVTANYDSSNSTYTVSLLASAENALNKVADKIDTTAVAQTYQTKSDMANYLTTSDAATTYQPKGNYAPETVTATVNTLTAASAGWNEVSAKLGTAQYANDSATFVTSSNLTITGTKQYALTTAGWAEVSTPTIPDITATSGISADGYTIGLTNTAIGAITSVSSKVDIPDTSLVDKYLALRTDNAGNVSGWVDLKDNFYSKTEATGTFVATANIDTTTLSGDGKTVSTKLGVKTNVIATRDYVNSSFLPLSGGTVSGDVIVKSTGKNLLAVNTNATLMGQSRVNSLTDTAAIGTNWMGVNSYGGGFLKNVQGGNVGDLDGTSIQINFAPNGNTAYGNITVNSQGNESKVVHVPTASYDSMSNFDNTNGPNYMLRKTASGFDIGACVINVTQLPAQTEANTYYFIYDT